MPKSVLTRKRSLIARIAVLAMIFSLMAVALPASAHSVALDTTTPCPAATPSAGFTDIGALDTTTQTAINCLFAFGITTGTSATTYSPNDTITRWQMALFLIRQAADHGLTIPAAVGQGYTDIGAFDTATQNAINQITQMGISKGTSSTTFSPNAGVTRWQMALFIYRTGVAAGVTFNNTATHNEFLDILTLSAEAQTAINALADTRADPEGHIALGTGLSLFSPDLILVRWQMALFLTRLLAADNIPAPSGTAVVVTPTAQATQASGTARAYSATLKNSDGTNYTGQAIIRLVDANADGTANGSTLATGVDIEAIDGTASAFTTLGTVIVGNDGALTFVVRHTPATASADTVPQVIRDTNSNGIVDASETIGSGGAVFFTFTPTELASGSPGLGSPWDVCSTDKADDFFVVDTTDGDCAVVTTPARVEYDLDDIYLGDAADMAEFETALSVGDVVGANPYSNSDAGQSTFTLTDAVTALTVDAVTTPVNANTQTLSGTGNPGWEVVIYRDQPVDDTYESATDVPVTVATLIGPDGDWSVSVPLLQETTNQFIAVQRVAGSSITAPVAAANVARDTEPVPPIVEQVAVGTSFQTTDSTTDAVVLTTLDPGDVVTITFTGDVDGVGSGDTISLLDSDGTTATIICGTHATCAEGAAGVVTVTMTTVLPSVGGTTGGINNTATITGLTGFTAADGTAISLTGDRTFTMP